MKMEKNYHTNQLMINDCKGNCIYKGLPIFVNQAEGKKRRYHKNISNGGAVDVSIDVTIPEASFTICMQIIYNLLISDYGYTTFYQPKNLSMNDKMYANIAQVHPLSIKDYTPLNGGKHQSAYSIHDKSLTNFCLERSMVSEEIVCNCKEGPKKSLLVSRESYVMPNVENKSEKSNIFNLFKGNNADKNITSAIDNAYNPIAFQIKDGDESKIYYIFITLETMKKCSGVFLIDYLITEYFPYEVPYPQKTIMSYMASHSIYTRMKR